MAKVHKLSKSVQQLPWAFKVEAAGERFAVMGMSPWYRQFEFVASWETEQGAIEAMKFYQQRLKQ